MLHFPWHLSSPYILTFLLRNTYFKEIQKEVAYINVERIQNIFPKEIHGTSICRYKFQSDFDQQEKNKISCLKIVLKFFLWSVVILMNRAVLLTLVVNDIQPSAYRVFIHAPLLSSFSWMVPCT